MQTPTCTNIRIRSIQDVHKIFAAVQRGWLQMIVRRLDTEERAELCTGCIYVWEERGPNTEVTGLGMERFTEGRRWSPSRVRDDFLFYFEQYTGGDSSENQLPNDWDPLIKQTYSALVLTERGPRKWHMTAYYTERTMNSLGSIDDIDGMRDLVVPEGTYTSHKTTKSKSEKKKKAGVTRKYAGFPQSGTPADEFVTSQSVQMFDPYMHTNNYDNGCNGAGTSSSQHQSAQSAFPMVGQQQLLPSPTIPPPLPDYSPYMSPAGYPSPGSSASSSSSHSSYGASPVMQVSPRVPPSSQRYGSTMTAAYLAVHNHHEMRAYSPSLGAPSTSGNAMSAYPGGSVRDASDQVLSHEDDACQGPPSPVSDDEQNRRGDLGPSRDLAPLHLLKRNHPYRRDPVDDNLLRKLDPRPSAGPLDADSIPL